MLKDNIKAMRRAKGWSQEGLAAELHAVRQTVSKWERGLSVPDADMLVKMAGIFGVSVSAMLGESVSEVKADVSRTSDLKEIAEKLEAINAQLTERKKRQRRVIQGVLILVCVAIVVIMAVLLMTGSPYAEWDYNDPETAVLGAAAHALEWAFVRVAPVMLVVAIVGIVWLRRKD